MPLRDFIKSFSRAQIVAAIATLIDFVTYVLISNLLGLLYGISAFAGACSGGITGFMLGRHWAFDAAHLPPRGQAFRYFQVWLLSAFSNSAGVYLLADIFRLEHISVKIAVSVAVGVLLNYPLHKYYVFNTSSNN